MNFVTYNNIRFICYLNFVLIAPHEVAGSPILARAIDYFNSFFDELKKKIKNYLFSSTYSFIKLVTISFTVVFCFNATILNSVLKSSLISITSFLFSLILITTLFVVLLFVKETINIYLKF